MTSPNRRDEAEDWREVPQLRSLRRLVTALTAVLMLGMLAVAVALIIRISMEPAAKPLSSVGAEAVTLPAGETITAVGTTAAAVTVATTDAGGAERLRMFDPRTGAEIGVVDVKRD